MRLSDFLGDDLTISLKKGETKPVTLHKVVNSVLARFPEVDASELDADIDHLLGLMEKCRKAEDWTGIKWRHAASAARATFTPPRSLDPKWDKLRDFLLRTLDSDHKRSFARASFSAYLEGFTLDSLLTQRLARSLERSWRSTLPQIEPLVTRFSIFDVRGLDRRLGEFMVKRDRPYDAMKEMGFASPHMSGLLQLAYRRFVTLRKGAVETQDEAAVRQVLHWLHPDDDTVLGEGQAAAIDALLLPWVNETPRRGIQERIRSELVDAYGDPRIQKGGWSRVSEKALMLMRRWLTGASLDQFLEIVSAVEGSHMWAPRRKFWEEMHARELIDEAWVILSSEGVKRARELARKTDDKSYLSHGRVTDPSAEARCYLMLRCGKGTVVEGSHNFSIRFYRPSNERCPSLYGDGYSQFRFNRNLADSWIPHTGAWQIKAQMRIVQFRKG